MTGLLPTWRTRPVCEKVRNPESVASRRYGPIARFSSAYEPVPESRLREERTELPSDVSWMVNPREDVQAVLDEEAERIKSNGLSDVQTFAREGDPADAILDVAEETNADLIVVGNKGMTGARRFLLGSVPNKVSHHAPCNVMIVRTT